MGIYKQERFGIARKIVANMTAESWETIPHSSFIYEPEVTKFLEVLKKLRNLTKSYLVSNRETAEIAVFDFLAFKKSGKLAVGGHNDLGGRVGIEDASARVAERTVFKVVFDGVGNTVLKTIDVGVYASCNAVV